jgi:phospholipase C
MFRAFGLVIFLFSFSAFSTGKHFDRVVIVVFENEGYGSSVSEPFFSAFAKAGANFSNYFGVTNPSQGNYIAMTSGDLNGVYWDSQYDLNVQHIGDLLEQKGLTWKVYAEDFPGNCFTGMSSGNYARKHNPFISYTNIQNNPARCANIVEAGQLEPDVKTGNLANYIFYVPNLQNDGHDTDVAFADKWFKARFLPLLNNPDFMKNTVVIATFDEGSWFSFNHIYTAVVGPNVKQMKVRQQLNHYSLLRMIEDNWDLGNLDKEDVTAPLVPNIWVK